VDTRPTSPAIHPPLGTKNSSRIICPNCGNDSDFCEVADGVILTTTYIQNTLHSLFHCLGAAPCFMGRIRQKAGEEFFLHDLDRGGLLCALGT
jgi:hypothetical protein